MKKYLFIDRDGTLIKEPPDEQVDSFAKLEFLPGVFRWLGKLVQDGNYELVMVTNQDGLGTASFPDQYFWPVHNFMLQSLKGEGIEFSEILIDRSFPADNSINRKPGIGMLKHYMSNTGIDLSQSWVIGDRETDVQLAMNLGCKSFSLNQAHGWEDCYRTITERKISHQRQTNETKIWVELNLDGSGNTNIKTGLPFFDHMLEQLGRHSGMDLALIAKGDLHIDEHHSIEDTAITLGEAIAKALGNKAGIERYGFCLPMDDCLAQVALDFGGRPWLAWDVQFKREKIGDMPTEMFYHFFKSFSDAAKCNLNIKAEGDNEHHKIESIFKALARSIKMAIARNESNQLPTTKGFL
jgi:imidazoleglycerol-phosphate dehydratase/histidinol-phosphatase